MVTIKATRFIAAPSETVFGVFTDLRNAPGRIRAIRKLEVLTDGPIGHGTRFRETRVLFGREATETMEIAEFQPPRTYSIACESCGVRYVTVFDFHPDRGGTRVDVEFNATPVSVVARMMSPLSALLAGTIRTCLENDLADFEAAVIAQPAHA